MTRNEQIAKMTDDAIALTEQGKKAEAKALFTQVATLRAQEYVMAGDAPEVTMSRSGGKHGIFSKDGKCMGYVSDSALKKHMRACMAEDGKDAEPDGDADDKQMREYRKEKGFKFSDVKELVERGQQAIASEKAGQQILMREAVSNGRLDRAKAAFVANEHRNVTTKDYIAVERADNILAKAAEEGKVTQIHRVELFEDVVANPEKWEKIFASAVPLFNVRSGAGIPGSTDGTLPTVQEEVDRKVKQYMTDHKDDKNLTAGNAMRAVFAEDTNKGGDLARRYEASRAQNKA